MAVFTFEQNNDEQTNYHFKRQRLIQLMTEAARYPLFVLCATAGYGKTSAVLDFVKEYQAETFWVQLSERDNVGARFWESFTHSAEVISYAFADACAKLGFPDTIDKINQYLALVHKHAAVIKRVFVLDDFHNIKEPLVIRFVEYAACYAPLGTSVFLISRKTPSISLAQLLTKGNIFSLDENDLRFTNSELTAYFNKLNIFPEQENMRVIMQDTEGWAFAINLIARLYPRTPGYRGYLRSAMKSNIFHLMETEIWTKISAKVQKFLICLSLIEHLSFELIMLLTKGDEDLTIGLEQQNAYVRRDSYINAYIINPLFLEFLVTKQELLTDEQKHETYIIAGNWCSNNDFKIDALSYYDKAFAYESIVSELFTLPFQMPFDIAKYAASILDKIPEKKFHSVDFLALSHIRSYMSQGLWEKSAELAAYYEAKFLKLPKKNSFGKRNLSGIYLCWAVLRGYMGLMDNCYDFDKYFNLFCKYYTAASNMENFSVRHTGPWINAIGNSGRPDEYINAVNRSSNIMSKCFKGFMAGEDDLSCGELKFYQGDMRTAEQLITHAADKAKDKGQTGIAQLALIYIMRLSIIQGNFQKAKKAIEDTKALFEKSDYSNTNIDLDISLFWYYYLLNQPENIPEWLKENFSPYGHAGFIENFWNQLKARFCYSARMYLPILVYTREMKQRESYLFGHLEMLVMEACIHYKMNEKKQAFSVLADAYKIALPNSIIMPFIELGKDMRTLCAAAVKEKDLAIPKPWLENIYHKAASYAKRQNSVISEYKQLNRLKDRINISPRELEILTDLCHGLSRMEIAVSRNLSINTVKMVINNIYYKTGAENKADLIRRAVMEKIV